MSVFVARGEDRREITMQLPLTGGCQCKGVRYQITAEPLTVYVCHCTECQCQSASAFVVPSADLKLHCCCESE